MLVFSYKKQTGSNPRLSWNPPKDNYSTFSPSIGYDQRTKDKTDDPSYQQKQYRRLFRGLIKSSNIKRAMHKFKRKASNMKGKTQDVSAPLVSSTSGLQVRKLKRSTHHFTNNYSRNEILHFFNHAPAVGQPKTTPNKIYPYPLDRNKYKRSKIIQRKTHESEQEQNSPEVDLNHHDLQSNISGWGQFSQQFTTHIYTEEDQSNDEVMLNPRLPSINLGFTSGEEDSPSQTEGAQQTSKDQQQQESFLQKQSLKLIAPSVDSESPPLSISIKQDFNNQTPLKQHTHIALSQGNVKAASSKTTHRKLTDKSITLREEYLNSPNTEFKENLSSIAINIESEIGEVVPINKDGSSRLSRANHKKDKPLQIVDQTKHGNAKSNKRNEQNASLRPSVSALDSLPKISTLNSHIGSKQVIHIPNRKHFISIRQETSLRLQEWGVQCTPAQNRSSLKQQLILNNIPSAFQKTSITTNNIIIDETEPLNPLGPSFNKKSSHQQFIDTNFSPSHLVQQQTEKIWQLLNQGTIVSPPSYKDKNKPIIQH